MRASVLRRPILCATLLLVAPSFAMAESIPPEHFALVVGVNKSLDPELKALRYADDDAARYARLFRQLGADVALLTRLDSASSRLFPRLAKTATPATLSSLRGAAHDLATKIAAAKKRGAETTLYIAYAGHGQQTGAHRGTISLEDARLTASAIARELVQGIGADRTHLLVDACNSFFLAQGRGPGGKRREAHGFARESGPLHGPTVGLLLSTSSTRQSHEWQAFQAGVFSHTVRSGLRGAADANGDAKVSYTEIAAFVERANESIANEKYRSRVLVRPPKQTPVLVELAPHLKHAIDLDGAHAGRYLLEDERGVRLADFHSAKGKRVLLLRDPKTLLYLRRPGAEKEYTLPPGEGRVLVATLEAKAPHVGARGAAHHAFSKLFSLPFDAQAVTRYRFAAAPRFVVKDELSWRTISGWSTLAVGVAALGTGLGLTLSAATLKNNAPTDESHVDRVARNSTIDDRNRMAIGLYIAGGVVTAAAAAIFFWPESNSPLPVIAGGPAPGGGATFSLSGCF